MASIAEQGFMLTLPARAVDRRRAAIAAGLLAAAFVAALPFARAQLPQVWAFIPAYQSALIVMDVITAVLLYSQFVFLRTRGLALLAAGYVLNALFATLHALSFPGLLAPAGLLGGGPQTTAWLYMFWHAGFPLLVIAYARLEDDPEERAHRRPARWIAGTLAAAAAAAAACTALATGALPAIMDGNRYTPLMQLVVGAVWLLSAAMLVALWRRRSRTVLDLWLMVVAWAWVFDIGLSAVFNGGRFDFGFYAGRLYGLAAAGVVLVALMLELLAARRALEASHRRELERHGAALLETREVLERHAERLRILRDVEAAVAQGRPPEVIASAIVEPLRRLLDVPRVIVNRFDFAAGEAEWIAAAGRRRVSGAGLRYPLRLLGDLDALRSGGNQVIDVAAQPQSEHTRALLASGVRRYMAVPMLAGGELIGAISFGGEDTAFPEEKVAIAREAATQLAIAITHARLLESVRGQARELEERVEARTRELARANAELESFSYSVSHDLRAPVRAVDGYARMLEEDYGARLDDEGRRLLGVVRAASGHMGQLIDDLLAFSRLGRQEPARRDLDMTALVHEVLAALGAQARARVEAAPLPAAQADPSLFRQVWTNLLDNALKYSGKRPDARVEVGGRAENGELVYWVRDNGVGFDMRYAGKLFGVFQRLHGADDFPGTGVGLAIVQRVVSRHGGRVWAEAAPGQGACFFFSLPEAA